MIKEEILVIPDGSYECSGIIKWREVYTLNKLNLNKPEYSHNREQVLAAMNEARMVLENLGEEIEL